MILLEDECDEIASASKKRRLGTEQARALEQSFDLENRLEPDRKARLARELGLHPRQVSVWFQNRRARWKTKQLERDYSVLKSRYEALMLDFDCLRRENGSLAEQIAALKAEGQAEVGLREGADGDRVDYSEVATISLVMSRQRDVFKVEEDWEEGCGGAGLFEDEHGSALAWFAAEMAGGGRGW